MNRRSHRRTGELVPDHSGGVAEHTHRALVRPPAAVDDHEVGVRQRVACRVGRDNQRVAGSRRAAVDVDQQVVRQEAGRRRHGRRRGNDHDRVVSQSGPAGHHFHVVIQVDRLEDRSSRVLQIHGTSHCVDEHDVVAVGAIDDQVVAQLGVGVGAAVDGEVAVERLERVDGVRALEVEGARLRGGAACGGPGSWTVHDRIVLLG